MISYISVSVKRLALPVCGGAGENTPAERARAAGKDLSMDYSVVGDLTRPLFPSQTIIGANVEQPAAPPHSPSAETTYFPIPLVNVYIGVPSC